MLCLGVGSARHRQVFIHRRTASTPISSAARYASRPRAPDYTPRSDVKPFAKGRRTTTTMPRPSPEAALRPNLRTVREKTQDQLNLQACHRVRSRLVSRRTATHQSRSAPSSSSKALPSGRQRPVTQHARCRFVNTRSRYLRHRPGPFVCESSTGDKVVPEGTCPNHASCGYPRPADGPFFAQSPRTFSAIKRLAKDPRSPPPTLRVRSPVHATMQLVNDLHPLCPGRAHPVVLRCLGVWLPSGNRCLTRYGKNPRFHAIGG